MQSPRAALLNTNVNKGIMIETGLTLMLKQVQIYNVLYRENN